MYQKLCFFVALSLIVLVGKVSSADAPTCTELYNVTSYRLKETNVTDRNNPKLFAVVHTITKARKICCPGYIGRLPDCQPNCSKGCFANSYCAAPEKCECKPNYEGDDCHPSCDDCGEFGYCQKPGNCACILGYKRNNDSGNCEPECSAKCSGNRYCASPDNCACQTGFEKDDCHPICDDCGEFGYCQKPGNCACILGFMRNNDSGNCEPECSAECSGNRYCASPDNCACRTGFEGDDCHPICDDCGEFGYCQEPGNCACILGYKRNNDSGNCEPECLEGCGDHGFCSAPDNCQCLSGFTMTTEGCQLETTTEKMSSFSPSSVWPSTTKSSINTSLDCIAGCQCWTRMVGGDSCVNPCSDDGIKSCLDLSHCRCSQSNSSVVCKEVDYNQVEYICSSYTLATLWDRYHVLIVIVACVIVFVVVCLLWLCIDCYQHRKRSLVIRKSFNYRNFRDTFNSSVAPSVTDLSGQK